MDIDGDEFAEADYGLIVDNSNGIQDLNEKLDTLAQAALQNQTLSFSTIMKLYGSCSIAEKMRLIEKDEKAIQERQAQAQQQQTQVQQQQVEANMQMKQQEMQQREQENIRDNETKLAIAQLQANSSSDGVEEPDFSEESRATLMEKMREFDAKLQLDKDKLEFDKQKQSEDASIKRQSLHKTTVNK